MFVHVIVQMAEAVLLELSAAPLNRGQTPQNATSERCRESTSNSQLVQVRSNPVGVTWGSLCCKTSVPETQGRTDLAAMFTAALCRNLPVLLKVTCLLLEEPTAGLGRNK